MTKTEKPESGFSVFVILSEESDDESKDLWLVLLTMDTIQMVVFLGLIMVRSN